MKGIRIFALCEFVGIMALAVAAQQARVCDGQTELPIVNDKKKSVLEDRIDEFITQKMEEHDAVGLSIVVVADKKIVYQKGFGFADKEKNTPVNTSTLFHIGSITKLFTGIGIMQLAERGLIDIDAPIQQYLPEFSIKYHTSTGQAITIRSIMAHQSGIFGDKLADWETPEYPEEDFRNHPEYTKDEYAAYPPNYTTAYSNFSVSLLGLIIERVSGERYETYIRNHVLKPCGMTESGFDPKNEYPTLFAQGYDAEGNSCPYYYISDSPAGFMASSSNNMAKFITMVMNNGSYRHNRILFPGTLRHMYHSQTKYLPMNLRSRFGSPYNFGLSWMLENSSLGYLGTVVGHGGNLPPYNSELLIAKDKNIGVFVTANKEDFYPNEIAYFALIQAAELLKNSKKPDLPEAPSITVMPDHLKRFVTGTYCVFGEEPIEIYEENDTMFYHQLHADRIPLVYHVDDWMSLYVNNATIPDVRLGVKWIDGKKVLCIEERDAFCIYRLIVGNHFIPTTSVNEMVCARCGNYTELSNGLGLQVQIDTISRSGKPFLKVVSQVDDMLYVLPLQPAEDSTFISQGLGRNAQETARFNGDTLRYSGFTFVKKQETQVPQLLAAPPVMAKARTVKEPEAALSTSESVHKTTEQVVEGLRKIVRKERSL